MEKKTKTFVFKGFGFPVQLIDAPMRKIDDEWILDINMGELERAVFKKLITKPSPLTGKELRFLRKSLQMEENQFSEAVGISRNEILQWEDEQIKVDPHKEIYVRIYFCNALIELSKQRNIEKIFNEVTPQRLMNPIEGSPMFSIDPKDLKQAS
jgi:DNA-binding transcriptional regulator YiaG